MVYSPRFCIVAGAEGFEPPTTGFGDQRSGQTELRSYMVPLEGLEPPTRDLGRRRSIHLSYRGKTISYIRFNVPLTKKC